MPRITSSRSSTLPSSCRSATKQEHTSGLRMSWIKRSTTAIRAIQGTPSVASYKIASSFTVQSDCDRHVPSQSAVQGEYSQQMWQLPNATNLAAMSTEARFQISHFRTTTLHTRTTPERTSMLQPLRWEAPFIGTAWMATG